MDAPFVYDFKSRYVYDQLLKCVHACVCCREVDESCLTSCVDCEICVSVCGVRRVTHSFTVLLRASRVSSLSPRAARPRAGRVESV